MTTPQASRHESTKELIDALSAARENVRLQWHLLSLEAHQRWEELESQAAQLQARLEHEGEVATEKASEKIHELAHALRAFRHEQRPPAMLSTPVRTLMKIASVCSPNDSLNHPARLMWELDCGSVPVVDDSGCAIGMVTDRDICMAAYTRGLPFSAIRVASTMSKRVVSVGPEASLSDAMALMRTSQVRRLPVVDQGRLVGIITLADIARHVAWDPSLGAKAALELAETLATISQAPPAGMRPAAE